MKEKSLDAPQPLSPVTTGAHMERASAQGRSDNKGPCPAKVPALRDPWPGQQAGGDPRGSVIGREVRRRYRIAHGTLHQLWTACVGTPGYDKKYWMSLDNDISERFADEHLQAGGTGPLLGRYIDLQNEGQP